MERLLAGECARVAEAMGNPGRGGCQIPGDSKTLCAHRDVPGALRRHLCARMELRVMSRI